MDEEIRNYVVGQDDAIHAVCDAVRMSRAGLNSPNRCVCARACVCVHLFVFVRVLCVRACVLVYEFFQSVWMRRSATTWWARTTPSTPCAMLCA